MAAKAKEDSDLVGMVPITISDEIFHVCPPTVTLDKSRQLIARDSRRRLCALHVHKGVIYMVGFRNESRHANVDISHLYRGGVTEIVRDE